MLHQDKHNLKYLTRLYYYGILKDWDYVNDFMIIKLVSYTATEYFGGSNTIRLMVPTQLEQAVRDNLIIGENYFIIAAPYSLHFDKKYRHRVDLLLNIFKEI